MRARKRFCNELWVFSVSTQGNVAEIDGTFDFISMIHSLKHFVDPLETLRLLRRIFNISGHLFIEVCNVEEIRLTCSWLIT